MPTIGITMGCPAGIGPEIILRYLAQNDPSPGLVPIIIGDLGVLEKCSRELGIPVQFSPWQPGEDLPSESIALLESSLLNIAEHSWGHPDTATANAMAGYIVEAVDLISKGIIDGMTTCPISKDSLQLSGYNFPGHTEMLVDLTGADNYTMMMAGSTLKVTLATIHCSLRDVPELLDSGKIGDLIRLTHHSLVVDFGQDSPRIALAGLNPHCGEGGMFGDEESSIILPALEDVRQDGIEVFGPYPPDTVFFKAAEGQFDCVICMYHDQGLIPFKLLHFQDGVNVTLGLPVVRTSVDHGTAYDIAGQGKADQQSLAAAVAMAADISNNRKIYRNTLNS